MAGGKHDGVDGLQPALAVADALLRLHLGQADFTYLTQFLYLLYRGVDAAGAAVQDG